MTRSLIALLALVASSAYATSWTPPDRFLKAVRFVESSDGLFLYGDEGRSLGDFQISEAAWLDVSSWRKARGLKIYNYDAHVFHSTINRAYAANYLTMIHDELQRVYKREPNSSEIYAAYNMGLSKFASCRYRLQRVNPLTARRCEAIRQYMVTGAPLRVALAE
jgi:hypothetical protein